MPVRILRLLLASTVIALAACGDKSDDDDDDDDDGEDTASSDIGLPDSDTDGDTDADTDADGDTDAGTDADTGSDTDSDTDTDVDPSIDSDGDGFSDLDESSRCGESTDPMDAEDTPTDADGDLVCEARDCDDTNPAVLFTVDSTYCGDRVQETVTIGTQEAVFTLITNGDGTPLSDPLGRYTLADFYIMEMEVTQGMFDAVGISIGPLYQGQGEFGAAYEVGWSKAAAFANAVSDLQGVQNCYTCTGADDTLECEAAYEPYECTGYSLPTGNEWEYAARSGTTDQMWTGNGPNLGGSSTGNCSSDTIIDGVFNPFIRDYAYYACYQGNSVHTVGQLLPNGFGLYVIFGNVSECTDEYETEIAGGETRIRYWARGGSICAWPYQLGAVHQEHGTGCAVNNIVGLRLRRLAP